MKEYRWQRREKKQHKNKNGMRIDNTSIKLLEQIKQDKAEKARKEKPE